MTHAPDDASSSRACELATASESQRQTRERRDEHRQLSRDAWTAGERQAARCPQAPGGRKSRHSEAATHSNRGGSCCRGWSSWTFADGAATVGSWWPAPPPRGSAGRERPLPAVTVIPSRVSEPCVGQNRARRLPLVGGRFCHTHEKELQSGQRPLPAMARGGSAQRGTRDAS